MKKALIKSIILATLYCTANATTSSQQKINPAIQATNNNQVQLQACTASDAKLSISCLNYLWENREKYTASEQTTIANYLLTQPEIPNDYEIAWKTARLTYFIGNFGVGEKRFTSSQEGVQLFDYGVSAGKIAKKINPNRVEGYYWYAVDLGSYGLAKGIIAAASSAGDGMDALKTAKKIDPSYQWYGSSRILGRYYQELPGIFGGSDKKALVLYQEAVEKAKDSRINLLYLGMYHLKDGDYNKAQEYCKKGLIMAPVDGLLEEQRYQNELRQCIEKSTK